MALPSSDGFQAMTDEREDGGQAFLRAATAPRQIDDEGRSAHPGDSAGEPRVGVALGAEGAHGLRQAGSFTVKDAAGSFRGHVARAQAGSADGEDEGWVVVGQLFQHGENHVFVVGKQQCADLGIGPLLAQQGDRGGAGGVLHEAAGAAVGDGQDG